MDHIPSKVNFPWFCRTLLQSKTFDTEIFGHADERFSMIIAMSRRADTSSSSADKTESLAWMKVPVRPFVAAFVAIFRGSAANTWSGEVRVPNTFHMTRGPSLSTRVHWMSESKWLEVWSTWVQSQRQEVVTQSLMDPSACLQDWQLCILWWHLNGL